uniref:Uncharacterized protein n=1 Tax=Ficedula albicollis TaxID=59894 RepID=U3JBY2_FICAL
MVGEELRSQHWFCTLCRLTQPPLLSSVYPKSRTFSVSHALPVRKTPLHLACINGHADVVQFLVEKKCKLNPRDKLNKSPLMKAVEHQHRDCAAILLEHGANPNHKGASGNTALHLAVMVSSKSLVDLLLEHGADIEAKNKLGYTPLALAITENCEEMAKFLLQKGADVNAQDNVFRKQKNFFFSMVLFFLSQTRDYVKLSPKWFKMMCKCFISLLEHLHSPFLVTAVGLNEVLRAL